VHAADSDLLIVELDDRVGVARAEDVLAKAAAGSCRACLAAFDLFGGRGWDLKLVSGNVSSNDINGIYPEYGTIRKCCTFVSRYVRM
jgi:hypothetical protein